MKNTNTAKKIALFALLCSFYSPHTTYGSYPSYSNSYYGYNAYNNQYNTSYNTSYNASSSIESASTNILQAITQIKVNMQQILINISQTPVVDANNTADTLMQNASNNKNNKQQSSTVKTSNAKTSDSFTKEEQQILLQDINTVLQIASEVEMTANISIQKGKGLQQIIQQMTGQVDNLKHMAASASQTAVTQPSKFDTALKTVGEKASSFLSWLPGGALIGGLLNTAVSTRSTQTTDSTSSQKIQQEGAILFDREAAIQKQLQDIQSNSIGIRERTIQAREALSKIRLLLQFKKELSDATKENYLQLIRICETQMNTNIDSNIMQITTFITQFFKQLEDKRQSVMSIESDMLYKQKQVELELQKAQNDAIQKALIQATPEIEKTFKPLGDKIQTTIDNAINS